jgi:uncharacterized oxidoreductase
MTSTPASRIAIVTGGGTGIGRGIALGLARRGVDVALVGRRADVLEAVAHEVQALGVRAVVIPADLAVAEERRGLLVRVGDALGPVDILVNNAGTYAGGNLSSLSLVEIEGAVSANLLAPIELTRLALPGLRASRGWVVLLGSSTSHVPLPYAAIYSATKSGIRGFGEALRYEVRGQGVHLLVAYPPPTETAMTRGMSDGAGMLNFPRANADRVGERIVQALFQGKEEIYFPGLDRPLTFLNRFAPRLVRAMLYSQRKRFLAMVSGRRGAKT